MVVVFSASDDIKQQTDVIEFCLMLMSSDAEKQLSMNVMRC